MAFTTLLLDYGANSNRKLSMSDYLLLRQYKLTNPASSGVVSEPDSLIPTTKAQILAGAASGSLSNSVSFFEKSTAAIFISDPKQYGYRGPMHFSPEFVENKFILPFEHAAALGNIGMAKLILNRCVTN